MDKDIEIAAILEEIEGGSDPLRPRGPARLMLDALNRARDGGSPSGAIDAAEADGQRSLVESSKRGLVRLPVEGTLLDQVAGESDNRKILESYGVVFGDVVEGDPIWVNVTLPEGWLIKPTTHSMWNDLLDDKGRRRAQIFYKAAFYDRSCHLHLVSRYSSSSRTVDNSDWKGPTVGLALDGDEAIQEFGPFESDEGCESDRSFKYGMDKARDAAKAWLEENFPNYRDVTAYWD